MKLQKQSLHALYKKVHTLATLSQKKPLTRMFPFFGKISFFSRFVSIFSRPLQFNFLFYEPGQDYFSKINKFSKNPERKNPQRIPKAMNCRIKKNSKDQAFLEMLCVKESSSLIGQEYFCAKPQEPGC